VRLLRNSAMITCGGVAPVIRHSSTPKERLIGSIRRECLDHTHDLSLAAFTINIAESKFRHTQVCNSARQDMRARGPTDFRHGSARPCGHGSRISPPSVRAIAWKAQVRLWLCARYRRLIARGKKTPVVTTAIARELSAFLWAIGQQVAPQTG
jgi:hypothetical protein